MGCLVKVSGVVTRRSPVFPQLKACKFTCYSCGYVLGPFTVADQETSMRGVPCPSCQTKGPYTLNAEQTVYCNYQKECHFFHPVSAVDLANPLSEAGDSPGISWLCAPRSPPAAQRSHSPMGPHRRGPTGLSGLRTHYAPLTLPRPALTLALATAAATAPQRTTRAAAPTHSHALC